MTDIVGLQEKYPQSLVMEAWAKAVTADDESCLVHELKLFETLEFYQVKHQCFWAHYLNFLKLLDYQLYETFNLMGSEPRRL